MKDEFDSKIITIREMLNQRNLDGLLLQKVHNFAWATCGASSYVNTADEMGAAALIITRDKHYMVTNNIEAPRLLKEEGLELQSWEAIITPWHQQENAFKQITNGLKMGSDTPSPDFEDVNEQLTVLRISLLPSERQRFAEVGRKCAEAMNKSIHQVKPGQSEFDIAAILNSETQKREVLPIVNLIATDERVFAYRHPLPTKKKLERYAMLVLCGRKYGLVCSITRFIHFGSIPDEIQVKANAVAKIDAALINSTKPGETLGSIFFKLQKQYAAVGFADEWQLHHQGGLAAYLPREVIATPNSEVGVSAGQAYAWNPSITGTKSEDTILIEEDGFKVITKIKDWPEVQVDLGDVQISRPSILVID